MLKLSAPAKINLGLKILQKRNDGFHDIKTVMQQIALQDILVMEKTPSEVTLQCYGINLDMKDNLIYQAAKKLKQKTGSNEGVTITLYKNIPAGAGLAGGSSNAAATLRGLNQLWNAGLSWDELKVIGKELGADVPFCLHGGTALAEGIGDKLTDLPKMPFLGVILARPPYLTVSTAEIYQRFSFEEFIPQEIEFSVFSKALEDKDRFSLNSWLQQESLNDLEPAALALYPEISGLKETFKQINLAPIMSGSGPTIFSLVNDLKSALQKAKFLEEKGYQAWVSWTQT